MCKLHIVHCKIYEAETETDMLDLLPLSLIIVSLNEPPIYTATWCHGIIVKKFWGRDLFLYLSVESIRRPI